MVRVRQMLTLLFKFHKKIWNFVDKTQSWLAASWQLFYIPTKHIQKGWEFCCSAPKLAPSKWHHYSGNNPLPIIESDPLSGQSTLTALNLQCIAFTQQCTEDLQTISGGSARTGRTCRDETFVRKSERMLNLIIVSLFQVYAPKTSLQPEKAAVIIKYGRQHNQNHNR